MEFVKCTNCKGTGMVPNYNGPKKWRSCPICHGTGKKAVKNNFKGGQKHVSN